MVIDIIQGLWQKNKAKGLLSQLIFLMRSSRVFLDQMRARGWFLAAGFWHQRNMSPTTSDSVSSRIRKF